MSRPTKDEIKTVIEDVDALDLPDGAYWARIHERLDMEYPAVCEIVAGDPEFFGWEVARPTDTGDENG